MGFSAQVMTKEEKDSVDIFRDVTPHDIVKYGIIPELVGRIPVIVALKNLDRDALVKILKEPKNAIVKQYKKLFGMDNVVLRFTDGALEKIADRAIELKTGARGLRSIVERTLIDVMYTIPSRDDVSEVVITADTVAKGTSPRIITIKDSSAV